MQKKAFSRKKKLLRHRWIEFVKKQNRSFDKFCRLDEYKRKVPWVLTGSVVVGKRRGLFEYISISSISKWKELCLSMNKNMLWVCIDSASFWSVSDKSQFTLTKHDLTIMGKFFNLCALRKDVDFELLMTAATTKTVFFFSLSSTLQFELRRNDSFSFWSVSDNSQFTLLSWIKMPFSATTESRLLVVDGYIYCLTK